MFFEMLRKIMIIKNNEIIIKENTEKLSVGKRFHPYSYL